MSHLLPEIGPKFLILQLLPLSLGYRSTPPCSVSVVVGIKARAWHKPGMDPINRATTTGPRHQHLLKGVTADINRNVLFSGMIKDTREELIKLSEPVACAYNTITETGGWL